MIKNLIFGWHQILKYYGGWPHVKAQCPERSDQSAATGAQRPKENLGFLL
jgi:hypothetical protein